MPVKRAEENPVPGRKPGLRSQDFREVDEGFCFARAMAEAEHCLRCQDPACIEGCPLRVPISDFMHAIAGGDLPKAARLLRSANPLASISGRVCPQEAQCEKKCHMSRGFGPVAIGQVERFVSDWEMQQAGSEPHQEPWRKEKIAVVGSGPSGLVCAGELARMGYPVTVYEALHAPGGVLRFGIPAFRLPVSILDREIDQLERLGVEFVNDVIIGETIPLDALLENMGYAAAFIGTGAGLPRFLGIPGESLNGVYPANEFLTRINLMQAFGFSDTESSLAVSGCVAVIGSDNAAMDAVRSALRLGAERAMVVNHGDESGIGARAEEYSHAIDEGVEFHWLTHVVEVLGEEGWVSGLKCVKVKPDAATGSGRARPEPIEGSEFVLPVDNVVLSIGSRPNPLLARSTPGLKAHSWGGLLVDERQVETSVLRVYAGGDAVTGSATVILAAGAGKRAAEAIHADLTADRDS